MKTIHAHQPSAFLQPITIGMMLLVMGILTGCQKDGTADRAGQKLDRSMENAEQKMERLTEKAEEKIEEAKQTLAEKTERGSQYLDDSVITLNVKTAIVNDPVLKVSEISVTTLNGVVQLSGIVDSQHVVDRASEVAQGQQGVKSVVNNLAVNALNDTP